MLNASQLFLDAMLSPIVTVYVKMDLFDKDENFIKSIEHHVGSDDVGDISVDKNRDIRRSFTLTLDNSDGLFEWGIGHDIWIDMKYIVLHIGLKLLDGTIEYVKQGTFIVTSPSSSSSPDKRTVSITGQDKWYLLTGNLGKFSRITTVTKGTKITTAIRTIAENAGITKMILDEVNAVVPYDHTYQIGQNRGDALKELAEKCFTVDDMVYEIFFDVDGYLRFQPSLNPNTVAPSWVYQIEENTLYAGSVRTLDESELYNHVIVAGGNTNTAEFFSEIIVTEQNPVYLNSPYSIEKIGRRVLAWNDGNPDSVIDTQSQCDARARYELNKSLRYIEMSSIDIAPNYLHEGGDIIRVVDSNNSTDGLFEIQSFNVPIRPKIVNVTAKRIRET